MRLILYRVWYDMKRRCTDANYRAFKWYGARGIKVYDEWQDFNKFFEDMSPTYRKGLELDRIDNNGDYCATNCKWETRLHQNRNRRNVMFPNLDKADLLSKKEQALKTPIGQWTNCIICGKPIKKRNKRNCFCCAKHISIYHKRMKFD